MTFPNLKRKHSKDSMFSPKDYLAYAKSLGQHPKFKPPKCAILCYERSLIEHILNHHKVIKVEGFRADTYLLDETNRQVALIGNFGIGAPVAVTHTEELIAFGVKKFISIGTAGTLQKDLSVGDIVICDRAIRDEGTSYHYLKPSKYAYASKGMTKRLMRTLGEKGQEYSIGTSWTIDAPYRETVEEARRYQKEGVATVEMEAAALFAVGQYRKVDVGAIFTISDSLAELEWKPRFHLIKDPKTFEILYQAVLGALLSK